MKTVAHPATAVARPRRAEGRKDNAWLTSYGGKSIAVFDKHGKPLTPPEGITFDGKLGLMQGVIVTPSGPGKFPGTRQHGLPDFRVSNLIRDTRTLAAARDGAESWLALDPALRAPESAALRTILEHRWKGRLGLAEIG